MTAFHFNAREVEPDNGRVGALPKGWYPSMVEKTEIKPTNDGMGSFIAVQFGVIDGPYKGSKVFTNFNITNASEKAVEIGRKQLSSLCHAVNLMEMTDTDQLKNRPFFLRVKHVPAEYNIPGDPNSGIKYEEKNEPTAYRDANDQAALTAYKQQGAAPAAGAPARPAAPPMTPPPAAAPQAWTPPPAAAPAAPAAPAAAPAQPAWGQPPAQPAAAPVQQMAAPAQPAWGQPPAQPAAAPAQMPPAGAQPAWAAAPVQPWEGQPGAQAAAAPAAPVLTPEQQAAHAASAAAPPPWLAQPQ